MYEANFSQREGIAPLEKNPQIKSMDEELKNGLWNMVSRHYLPKIFGEFERNLGARALYVVIYEDFFKTTSDSLPNYVNDAREIVKDAFFKFTYAQVYDFIEFLAKFEHYTDIETSFTDDCNYILNREFAGYNFVAGKILPRITDHEISEIEKAAASPLNSVNEHITQAIALMSNKEKPDYRNSIKESLSAVESICQKITEKPNDDLHKTIDFIKSQGKITIPPPLLGAIDKIYGYASSFQGIRHAKPYEVQEDASQEEALFMVIWCSAFVNYLVVKSEKSKILLK